MMFHKKGQGLSVNAIIVALLALIVLVVLVVMFVSQSGKFEAGTGKEGNAELIKMKITYGACRPTTSDEVDFKLKYSDAVNAGTDVATIQKAQAAAEAQFEQRINVCRAVNDKSACEAGACTWKG